MIDCQGMALDRGVWEAFVAWDLEKGKTEGGGGVSGSAGIYLRGNGI